MPRVVGIDPGTVSFDVLGLEDGDAFLERSVPTPEVARHPETLVGVLQAALPLDLIAGPSGYGLPLAPIEAVGERELKLLCLARPGEGSTRSRIHSGGAAGRVRGGAAQHPPAQHASPIGGLRTLVRLLRETRLPVIFTPGVIHLPTVPAHRKVNRIDLGTADKVCAAAAAIEEQSRWLDVPYAETSFVLAELGGAFTAVLSVEGGRIVGGQGGSSGPLGYLACGALDGEVACLLGAVRKETVFSGGVAFVAGDPGATPEALALRQDEAWPLARDAFVESLVRAVAAELAAVSRAREILLSGRLSRIPGFREPVVAALSRWGPVRCLDVGTKVKEAARGAALIADGLAGGRYRELVEVMRLREARGTVLDRLYLTGAEEVRRWSLSPGRC
jgi:predicted butyrate kinase (DUF1464 family)